MPTDPSKQAQQILEIPAAPVTSSLINDRIQQINLAFQKFLQNPALGEADLAQFRIINLADPKDDLDGVNLRTLKRFAGQGIAQQVTGTGSGIEQPTIYFTIDGEPSNGEASPYAQIMANRAGFTPIEISVTAVTAPSTADLTANVIKFGAGNMLASDLTLPIGSVGPVYATGLALPGPFALGTLLQGVVVIAGGASQVTIAIRLRGLAS